MTTPENVLYASTARPWLKYYAQKYIDQTLPTCSAFDYVCQQNKNRLGEAALNYYGRKFTYADFIVNVKKTAAALRGVGTEQDAEEAAADAFVYLWEHPEKFDPRRGSLKTWLSVVARSRALDRSREISRCRAVSLEEIELADPLGVPEALLAGERRAALNAAVDALAEPDREILLRRYYFGQKPREIAAALGLDKKQVDNRLYQTKRRLRASVTGAEGE